MTKILIAGIGGVGGYFGGLLAHSNAGSTNVEVNFMARGEHLAAIQNHGLKVIKGEKSWIARPYLATANPTAIGEVDYIIICTKNYDLLEILPQLKPAIGPRTVLLPLLNGVEAVEKIREQFPDHLVPAGCAYIVSAVKASGIIENMGTLQKIYFGLDREQDERLTKLEELLKQAGIDATLSADISTVVWEKFIFLSCIATATSYFNKTIGKLLVEDRMFLDQLVAEVSALAMTKGISVDKEISAKTIAHYESLPFDATSSMHRDYLNLKSRTELDSLTGFVVKEAEKLSIETPNFKKAYLGLLNQ